MYAIWGWRVKYTLDKMIGGKENKKTMNALDRLAEMDFCKTYWNHFSDFGRGNFRNLEHCRRFDREPFVIYTFFSFIKMVL